ncbi:transposase [Anaerosolibacter sp.]|uniref:transposase n=1 Tax=Anaerosolibacter sp. TaxID=1872527 RepID=UPI0039EE13F3
MGNIELPKRKTIRLKYYDYSQSGYYFVTICTGNRRRILGNFVGNDALIVPSDIGVKVIECWSNIDVMNENIKIDIFCLMPNHIHGIIIIEDQVPEKVPIKEYVFEATERRGRRSLPGIIRDFKSVTTRYYNKMVCEKLKNTLWQRSYYEHIIRSEKELNDIREYMVNNPGKWQEDKYFIK